MKMYMVILADPEDGSQKAHFFDTVAEIRECLTYISADYLVEVYTYTKLNGYTRVCKDQRWAKNGGRNV